MANTWLAGFIIIFFYLRSVCRYVSIGVLHWDDLDQEQRSEITRIILHQRNRQIHKWYLKDSSVPLMYFDPCDLGSILLIGIIPRDRTL